MARLSNLSRSVNGRVVLITGAGSGMGRATAYLFGDEGAHVAATDVAGAEAVAEAITGAGGNAHAYPLNVTDPNAIATVVARVVADFGGIDILINNAGIGAGSPIDGDNYEAVWARALDVLLTAHVRMVRAVLPYLRKSDAARIVNIASTEGLGATRLISPYTAAKTGVIGLTRSLALELGTENITVNCICPGPVRTGMTDRIPEADKQTYARRRLAIRRYADPEEVAHMTLSLCLPAASFVTGVALPVDGGLTIRNA